MTDKKTTDLVTRLFLRRQPTSLPADGTGPVSYWDKVSNIFCPTGKGGGIDPTCGAGGKAGKGGSVPTPQRATGLSADRPADGGKPLGGGASASDPAIRAATMKDAEQNYESYKKRYLEKMGKFDENGKLRHVQLNTDEWRELFPQYKGTNAQDVHDASSYLNKRLLAEVMVELKGKGNNTVLVLAGGGGSGKGSAVKGVVDQAKYPIVVDQVSDNVGKVGGLLKTAGEHGFKQEVVFIDRNPREAYMQGVVPRATGARERGELARTVPLDIAVEANIKARKTALEQLKNNPDLQISVVDNNNGLGRQRLITDRQEAIKFLEGEIPKHQYEKLQKELKDEVKSLYEQGQIPVDIARGLIG